MGPDYFLFFVMPPRICQERCRPTANPIKSPIGVHIWVERPLSKSEPKYIPMRDEPMIENPKFNTIPQARMNPRAFLSMRSTSFPEVRF